MLVPLKLEKFPAGRMMNSCSALSMWCVTGKIPDRIRGRCSTDFVCNTGCPEMAAQIIDTPDMVKMLVRQQNMSNSYVLLFDTGDMGCASRQPASMSRPSRVSIIYDMHARA